MDESGALLYNSNSIIEDKLDDFEFIKHSAKLKSVIDATRRLNLHKSKHNTVIFVYSAPKVGSTSIVSSLRIFCSNTCDIIHIHDEETLKVLANITDVTVNEIILYNKHLGKNVFVIDVYRSPIERKISIFFEKIGPYHFNNIDSKVNKYDIIPVIQRFNNVFPYIGNDDHFIDKFAIPIPAEFNFKTKYVLVENNGIKYIKLRLMDSNQWHQLLTKLLGTPIVIVKDYESLNKPIKDLYINFKKTYKIPINLLETTMQCKHLNYYYSDDERNTYYATWILKKTGPMITYNADEYKFYQQLCMENSHIDYIQLDHYRDEGCCCKACSIKRNIVATRLLNGLSFDTKICHIEAKTELLVTRAIQVNKINSSISQSVLPRRKQFATEMGKIVAWGK